MVRQGTLARRRLAFPLWLAAFGLLAACYIGGPFLTLWRITRALDSGDTVALQSLIDWASLRQGLKDDIADGVIGMPRQTMVASNTLPPFGASFISGIAGSEIDRSVTPQGLLQAARWADPVSGSEAALSFPAIVGAGFITPTQFDLRLRAPCQDTDEEPLHVRMVFQAGLWKVVRVWIPQDMMDRASSGT
jgi:hypothetical protein